MWYDVRDDTNHKYGLIASLGMMLVSLLQVGHMKHIVLDYRGHLFYIIFLIVKNLEERRRGLP